MKLYSQFLFASMLCLLSFGSTAQAADHIKDNLGLFSDKAKAAANQKIDEVWKQHNWMIAIETRKMPPLPDSIDADNKNAVNQFLTKFAKQEFEKNDFQGVYMLIVPGKYRIEVSQELLKQKILTPLSRVTWETILERNLRNSEYDAALSEVVASMAKKLSQTPGRAAAIPAKPTAAPVVAKNPAAANNEHAAHEAPANEGSSMMMWLLVAGGVFILFMILRGILRGMNQSNAGGPNQYGPGNGANMGGPNMGQPCYGPGYGAPSRGGGFMSGMLGGLFGGVAGNMLYDQFSGRNQAHGSEPSSANDGSHLSNNSSSDYTSSSTDNEPTSFGGGDWGSADSGGGGGDWGDSGGGDFGGDGGGGGDW